MKQSTRIRMYKEYRNHPLRKEYEANKRKVKKHNKSTFDILGICACMIPIILFFVYGYLFFSGYKIAKADTEWNNAVYIIILGLINVFICLKVITLLTDGTFSGNQTEEYKKVVDKYEQMGLIEVDDPFNAKCGEYDDDDEYFVCSANMQPLNNQERVWCSTAGNCKHCARFIRAMGFDPEYSTYEIQKW